MKDKTNSFELRLYTGLWLSAIVYSIYKLFLAQTEILKIYNPSEWADIKPGWDFLARQKDVSDIEWNMWKFFFHSSWYHLIFQFVMSELIRDSNKSFLKIWYILSSFIFIVFRLGTKQLMSLALQPLIYMMVIFCGGGNKCTWLLSIALLVASSAYPNFYTYIDDGKNIRVEEVITLFGSLAWGQLRCISFCIDYINRKNSINNSEGEIEQRPTVFESILNILSYVFYLPLLSTGPIVLYEDFEKSFRVQPDPILRRLKNFICDMTLFLAYTFILECGFHYIYFYAMQNDIEILQEMPTLALWGGALWIALEFHLKYVITYGITTAFARLDNVEAPPTPRCIFRIHLYSQMWRYFDVGLYKFLVKYIYVPSLGKISQLFDLPLMAQKLTGSFVTFLFVFAWHGINREILVWFVLNFAGVVIESIANAISTTESYSWFKNRVLRTDEMEMRFLALACTPLLIMSALTNFCLLGSSELGFLFYKSYVQPSWISLYVTVAIYFCCYASIALESISSRTDTKTIKKVEQEIMETMDCRSDSVEVEKEDVAREMLFSLGI